jgi:hypothetical protein
MFNVIPDATIVTRSNGVFRQHAVYQHKGQIFIKWGSGYVYVMRNGTSVPKVFIDEMVLPFEPRYDVHTRAFMPETKGRRK